MTAGQNEEHQSAELKPNVTTIADCLSPLLTSMNLFGLYFKSERCEMSEGKWLRRRRNLSVIHSAVLAVLMWINVVRMFSVFTAEEEFGELIFFKLICSLRRHYCSLLPRVDNFKTLTLKFDYFTFINRHLSVSVQNRVTSGGVRP